MRVAGENITRLVVVVVLGLATGAMFLISMRGNYLYGYALGQSEEKRELFAWANVAADVWKAFGLIAVTMLWRNRHRRVALVGSIAWFVCLLSGVNSAIGVYVQDRTELTGSRQARHTSYRDTERELEELESKLKGLPAHRSIGQVEAALAAALKTPIIIDERVRGTVGERTANCTKIDSRTAETCARVSLLAQELATAKDAQRLEARIALLRHELKSLREGGSVAPDPLGEFYEWATRGLLSVRDVGFGFPLFFALLIEVVSAFGPITVARYAESSLPEVISDMARYGRPQPAVTGLVMHDSEHVIGWMAQRARPSPTAAAITIEELHDDYEFWCSDNGFRAGSMREFAAEFDRVREMPELTGKIRKFGNRYYGIALGTRERSLAASREARE